MNVKSWIIVVLGIWLAVAAFLTLGMHGQELDNLAVGLVVAIVGFSMMNHKPAIGWGAGLLGGWVVISAFIPTLVEGSGLHYNNVIFGVLIAVAGIDAMRKPKQVY